MLSLSRLMQRLKNVFKDKVKMTMILQGNIILIALKCHYNRNTNPIVGDSVLSSIAERKICKRERKIKIKYFTGVTIDDMYDCDKPL